MHRLQWGVAIQRQQAKEKLYRLLLPLWDPDQLRLQSTNQAVCVHRLQQGVVIQKQQAKEKLHKLVAPLLSMHHPDQLSLQAIGTIQPKLNLSFSEVGATLRDGTIILQGVTGHFNSAKVPCSSLSVPYIQGFEA